MSSNGILTRLNGVIYPSVAEAARATGLNYQTLQKAFYVGDFKGLGIGKGNGFSEALEHDGVVYPSIAAFCRKFGLVYHRIQADLSRLRKEGGDILTTEVGEVKYLGKYREVFGAGRWSPN